MARGLLYQKDYHPQFSGHETFPLRYGWFKKAYDRVAETEWQTDNKLACWGHDAIAHFGVGKNMVASIRHWANAANIITEPDKSNSVRRTELGRRLFDANDGLDPYMEHPSTIWLIHWQLASPAAKTTWHWAFNYYPTTTFDREHLIKGLERLVKDQGWRAVARKTLENDVACFVRTYATPLPSSKRGHDDVLESPLTELGLIKATGKRDGFRFVRGPKSTLGEGVFVYALMDFWLRSINTATLSFENIAHAPGGPGRVFLLDENDVVDRLAKLDEITNGLLRWSETAGLKQVIRRENFDRDVALSYLRTDYRKKLLMEVA